MLDKAGPAAANRTPYKPLREKILVIDQDTSSGLIDRGINCAQDFDCDAAGDGLDRADALLSLAPDLKSRINICVEEIVVLQAPADEFDVSHSEPDWRDRIYISIPKALRTYDLRVVEAVIHESMHLNLTNLESVLALVRSPNAMVYSPWRDCERPAGGVLHGLYVFTCVLSYFTNFLLPLEHDQDRHRFISNRIAEIENDMRSVNLEYLCQCLTGPGKNLVENLS